MQRQSTIGLCMIVKDEADIILRAIDSTRPLLDYVLIEDTGSTDGTQQIVRDYLRTHQLPGTVIEQPWQDFATNRSSALATLRQQPHIDYALIMDADDILLYDPGFDAPRFKASLTAESYNVTLTIGSVTYLRPQLCSNRLPFQYRGVLHEFLELPPPRQPVTALAQGLGIRCGQDGARGQHPDKYQKDAALLERALLTEQDPLLLSRYTFYLAQSHRDAGAPAVALPFYLRRAEMGHWNEEAFVSLYEAARIADRLSHPDHIVLGLFLKAYERCPQRAESLHGAMAFCRTHALYHQGYLIGRHAVTLPQPDAGLFLEPWIYDYGLFDEFSVLAYWSGHFEDCLSFSERLLREARFPPHELPRIESNARFAREKLGLPTPP